MDVLIKLLLVVLDDTFLLDFVFQPVLIKKKT